ncbi:NAD(P)H-dependent oxidoreductase [Frateuria defendens]|uniref:NAD(P)H-dependent oxidoreductase n=1 Tax=Frateuria defendens TaxID=2219559 RepID=UPI00066FD0D7|nr:NAD(P)H-dependent oxidoreductase [Frateuria defendens]
MKCLVVIAHPLPESLCGTLARTAIEALEAAGHTVQTEDLYGTGFAPALTAAERGHYYREPYRSDAQAQIDRLLAAEGLVLCFPTWWFGFPAVLKGWFDRAWAPGAAYDHAGDLGPIQPRLHGLRKALAITSLGSPWWVDRQVMRRPVRRVLKTALLGTCAPRCRLDMLSLYKSERLTAVDVEGFRTRIRTALAAWPRP